MNQKERRRRQRQKKRAARDTGPQVPPGHRCDMSALNRAPSLDRSGERAIFEGHHCPVCHKKFVRMSYVDSEGTERHEWRSIVKFDGQGEPVLA